MKRNWDYIRQLLTDIEEEQDVFINITEMPKWNNQPLEEYEAKVETIKNIESKFFGHLELLIDSGYIDGITLRRGLGGNLSYSTHSPRLTMAGHDLLSTMRSSKIWESIKSNASQKGIELTFETIKVLGAMAIKHIIG